MARQEDDGFRCALPILRTVKPLDVATHDRGLEIAERNRYSIYDSMLLGAAIRAGCSIFYSEDLQHGQTIDRLRIVNPFEQ